MTDNNKPEEMASFFDKRAQGYDQHMHASLQDSHNYYQKLAEPIGQTLSALEILDIGCGTGLEIPPILEKAPNAHLTVIDLSAEMLRKLKEKLPNNSLTIKQGNYLQWEFGHERFDVVLSSMTLHHLLPAQKRHLYQKIWTALELGGVYIEGDYIVSPKKMERLLMDYQSLPVALKNGSHHIDIPLSLDKQTQLLIQAGFQDVKLVYEKGENIILTVQKKRTAEAHAIL